MISKIIRISGIATILAITFTCIFLSLVVKDIPQFHAQNRVSSHVIFKYPSVIEDMFYDYRTHHDSSIINSKIVLAERDRTRSAPVNDVIVNLLPQQISGLIAQYSAVWFVTVQA